MTSDGIERTEIQLEDSWSLLVRICISAVALLFLAFGIAEYAAEATPHTRSDNAKLLVTLFFCGLFICDAFFKSNLRWTLRRNVIQIDRTWMSGRRITEFVRNGDITEIKTLEESGESGRSFRIWIRLASGQSIESPTMREASRANELKLEIARRLNVAGVI